MKLFTKVADLSNHMGPLTHLADTLLSRVAPQKPAEAGVPCGSWENVGCCAYRSIRYRRYCFRGSEARPEYKCVSTLSSCG
ncbi:MAG: hypothetical protein GFH27_549309n52 [Chloroflexi bacterium AL-W]|nr:hypothetical protein [Chloroflexi bacterium AL-N1]NOK69755.1 hypothetical protein [Chloroflexi bacterium AL-N10]NOK73641.1 hypothetical protein [Chloroflexi bacterium AL-N5]NOK83925.1 hypothetical protein [Chloroflexi bacterium AL-W]NOK87972.1 hypothetical protein [Chloroflexi bacterium AL-N15]